MKPHTLLVVESPAKAKTIERYLGEGYAVSASMGHLIDLPRSRMAIDVENDFEPEYITVRGKAKILRELQVKADRSGHVLLASDNDREGEAISYHLKEAFLKKNGKLKIERIIFNEITPLAIRKAVQRPMLIDEAKVNAQKARRVLDRLVGYNLSPLLWKKVKNGLSAGRVQSVALRLICEREKEVENFIPEEYWTLDALLRKKKSSFSAQLIQIGPVKAELKAEPEVLALLERLKDKSCRVVNIKKTEKQLKPKAPYTTSKLQQEAANRLGFTSRKTMQIAQQLYEGVNIGSERVGLITYMRTDSIRVSNHALEDVRAFILDNYPDELPENPIVYPQKKGAQDAHEAIRPTYTAYTPAQVKDSLSRDQHKLYSLIWERFVSSQMTNARTKTTSVDFEIGEALFRAAGTKVVEGGFQRVQKLLKPKGKAVKLPPLSEGEELEVLEFTPEQHYTSGPVRYTDASIVKALEEGGIGRPSTYAPIISVLLDRYYVVRRNKQLMPTVLGKVISDILVSQFPNILESGFTASLEEQLDEIEEEKVPWRTIVKDFYTPFIEKVSYVNQTLESVKGVLDEKTDEVCEKCERPMLKKLGRYGFFLACSGFPECRNSKPIPLASCPLSNCGGKIVARKKQGRSGKEFYGCSNYPDCNFITHFKPSSADCPGCGWFLVEKLDKKRGSHRACINPDCDFTQVLHDKEEKDG